MSSTFDTMASALALLAQRLTGDGQASDVVHYLQEIVQRMHDADHRAEGRLNRLPRVYPAVRLLQICLQYENDELRRDRLSIEVQNNALARARVERPRWTGEQEDHDE